jgi:hypothetical protein
MKVITYLLYGDNRSYQLELAFSVLSALRFLRNGEDVTVSIISDRADLGFDLPIDRIHISSEEIVAWTQNGTYNHRAKILALIKAIDHYQAPTILIDTDTYFTDNPMKLFQFVSPQASLMHDFETVIGEHPLWQPLFAGFNNNLDEKQNDSISFDDVTVSPQSPMFNSGVVGVDVANRSLLNKALELLDRLHTTFSVFNTEQFALGTVLNQATKLSVCPEIVKHYWGHERDFIHTQVSHFLETYSLKQLDSFLDRLPALELGYPYKPLSAKLATRFLSLIHQWDHDYRFAYLAYCSALHYAKTNVAYANIWTKIARRSIDLCLEKHPEIQADDRRFRLFLARSQRHFRQFSPSNIDALTWLAPDMKQHWLTFWQG